MRLQVLGYSNTSIRIAIPEQCKSTLGDARPHMDFADLPSASRYFSKLLRNAKRTEQFARFGQAELDANLMPKHTSKPKHGILLTGAATGRFKTFAQR